VLLTLVLILATGANWAAKPDPHFERCYNLGVAYYATEPESAAADTAWERLIDERCWF